jgi:hypothetical protein
MLPFYHLYTGNLPPLSDLAQVRAEGDSSDDEARSSARPHPGGFGSLHSASSSLPAGWVELPAPLSAGSLYWHTTHCALRTAVPTSADAGRALPAVQALAARTSRVFRLLSRRPWRERWCADEGRPFYWNARTGESTWARPPNFWADGLRWAPLWLPRPGGGWTHRLTGEVLAGVAPPPGCDAAWWDVAAWRQSPFTGMWTRSGGEGGEQRAVPAAVAEADARALPVTPPPRVAVEGAAAVLLEGRIYGDVAEEEAAEEAQQESEVGGWKAKAFGAAGAGNGSSLKAKWWEPQVEGEEEDGGGARYYPPIHGVMQKRGGGMSTFGGTGWRERFFVSEDGELAYYSSQAAFEAGEAPRKPPLRLDLYAVIAGGREGEEGGSNMFSLHPRNSPLALVGSGEHHVGAVEGAATWSALKAHRRLAAADTSKGARPRRGGRGARRAFQSLRAP